MKQETKSALSQLTLKLLCLVALGFVIGVLVIVLCAGLQINPFRQTTTSFLVAAFIGSIGLAAVLVLLNVALNISLIADSRILTGTDSKAGSLRRWYVTTAIIVLGIVGIVFVGTYVSKDKYLQIVRNQADEILKDNSAMLDEISLALASGTLKDYGRISDIMKFLENQRSQLPLITVIYSGKFDGKLALYEVPQFINIIDSTKNKYQPSYYACDRAVDCDYLKAFFSGQPEEILQKNALQSDNFAIYVPVVGKESRFILFFQKFNRYGKLGSSG